MMQKWFPDKKGLATGITLAVLGVSATILSPLSSTWLTNYGFTGTFRILAVIFAVVAVFGMLTIKAPPAGYMADYKPSGVVAVSKNACTTARDCFRCREYYLLSLVYFCAIPAFVLLSAIFVSYGTSRGLDKTLLVTGVSVASLMPSLTTDYLGSENAGLVCSLVMIGFGVASVGTSFLAKAVNTSMAFILAGVIAIVGILVTLALPKLGKAEQ